MLRNKFSIFSILITRNLLVYRSFLHFTGFLLMLSLWMSCAPAQRFPEFSGKQIHHFDMVKIGGVRQAVLINGDRTDNPVLVFLHGGPGFPMLPFEPFSESMRRLESQYTVVYWEQRGTGKSFSRRLDRKSMNMEQFISDTREVIDYVREFLNVDKVYLWGHSWGSNVGAIYASRYPETLHAYISTGQSVDPFQNERLAYEFVRDKAIQDNNPRALRQLARIDTIPENYTLQNALTIRKWVYRYGGIVYQTRDARPYVDLREIITMLTTPVYSLGVRINLLLNPYFSAEELWEDLMETNLLEQAPEIEVPVYFLVGRHDIIVSHYLAEKYFMELSAPRGKKLIWFEESAHRPFSEEKDKFLQIMKTTIPEYQIRGFSIDQIPVLP